MGRSTVKYISMLLALMLIASVGGVFAVWQYAGASPAYQSLDVAVEIGTFLYVPEEMPDGEVSLVQRLSDILNRKYTTAVVTDSQAYLINKTIQVYWGGNIYADPYVGSMDANYSVQINELFGDIMTEEGVSFLLKRQDLNGDGYKEIAMYSTSDPLDCVYEYDGTVCVYVSVFTPVIDDGKNIIGYNLVCESVRGYCSEVYYDPNDHTPSFSTDEWRDSIAFYHYFNGWYEELPEELKLDYNSYNQSCKYTYEGYDYWGSTAPYGNRLWQVLDGKIPYLT